MNNYFKNYMLVFLSFFILPAFAMENPSKIAAELIALTQKEKNVNYHKKNLLGLEQNKKDAENWFNKETENPVIDPLLKCFIERGDNVPTTNPFLFDYQIHHSDFARLKTNVNIQNDPVLYNNPPYIKKKERSRRTATPIGKENKPENLHEHTNPVLPKTTQNCLLM